MDESVQRQLEKQVGGGGIPPDLMERLRRGGGGDDNDPRYAWRFWDTNFFCLGCLLAQPLTFKEVLTRHGFWETGIAVSDKFKPSGRPFPLDR